MCPSACVGAIQGDLAGTSVRWMCALSPFLHRFQSHDVFQQRLNLRAVEANSSEVEHIYLQRANAAVASESIRIYVSNIDVPATITVNNDDNRASDDFL